MVEVTSNSAYDVKIESVLIESPRLTKSYEIVRNVTEINIFENLDAPFLTGTILIADSSNIFNLINFQGTEKVIIKVKIGGDDRSKTVTKHFVVTDLGGVAPINDTSETIILNIIEDFAYQSRLMTVSKMYSGKPEEIISKIMLDNLKKKVDVPSEFSGSSVPPMKVIIPALSPLDAARWIKARCVSLNGMPFFLYSTLNAPNLFLVDLEYMLKSTPANLSRSYVFGQAFTRSTIGQTVDQQARAIESYRLPKSENMYKLAKEGALNSSYTFVDSLRDSSVQDTSIKVNMEAVLKDMVTKGILSKDQAGPIYDDKFKIDDKLLSEYTSSVYTEISGSNTFENFCNYYESNDINQQKMKAQSRALRYYLLKSPLEIVMPGFDFLGRGPNITIGKQIRINILKNDPNITYVGTDALDKKRTGDYIIYACRHIMRPEKYTVALMCVKLGNKE